MKKKQSPKLSLHRETLRNLDRADLRTAAGATAQLGCGNTFNNTCKTCGSGLTCAPSCLVSTCGGTTCQTQQVECTV
jgi:hypothetical protein